MSSDGPPLDYWTPATPIAARGAGPLVSGPQPTGCGAMLGVVVVAAVMALGIVTVLGWVLA